MLRWHLLCMRSIYTTVWDHFCVGSLSLSRSISHSISLCVCVCGFFAVKYFYWRQSIQSYRVPKQRDSVCIESSLSDCVTETGPVAKCEMSNCVCVFFSLLVRLNCNTIFRTGTPIIWHYSDVIYNTEQKLCFWSQHIFLKPSCINFCWRYFTWIRFIQVVTLIMLNLKRSIRPIQLFYSHLKPARTVTTWSHLANHFNSKPEEDRWAFLKCEQTVSMNVANGISIWIGLIEYSNLIFFWISIYLVSQGLLGFPELKSHDGFYLLQENVTQRCDELVTEIISPDRQRKIVEVFDELSDTLCKVADMTEFVRLAHPSSSYTDAAEEACFEICKIVEKFVFIHSHSHFKENTRIMTLKHFSSF